MCQRRIIHIMLPQHTHSLSRTYDRNQCLVPPMVPGNTSTSLNGTRDGTSDHPIGISSSRCRWKLFTRFNTGHRLGSGRKLSKNFSSSFGCISLPGCCSSVSDVFHQGHKPNIAWFIDPFIFLAIYCQTRLKAMQKGKVSKHIKVFPFRTDRDPTSTISVKDRVFGIAATLMHVLPHDHQFGGFPVDISRMFIHPANLPRLLNPCLVEIRST